MSVLDHTTIQVEAAGYGTSSRTGDGRRTYPNLSDADVSLVPKSVNENGRTLTLADVSWQEAAVDPTDGYDIPIRYTAVASYHRHRHQQIRHRLHRHGRL